MSYYSLGFAVRTVKMYKFWNRSFSWFNIKFSMRKIMQLSHLLRYFAKELLKTK